MIDSATSLLSRLCEECKTSRKYRFLHWPPEHPWTMLYFMKPVTRRGASDALKHDFPGAGRFSLRMLTQEARWKG